MRKVPFYKTETKSSDESFVSKRTFQNFTFLSATAGIFAIVLGGTFYIIRNAIDPLKKDIAKIQKHMLKIDKGMLKIEAKIDKGMLRIEEELKQLSNDNKIAIAKTDQVYFQVLKSNERLAVVEKKQNKLDNFDHF